jgi:FKBP-type peptidyl-prolyl cis-trans isomerase FklB
MMKAEEFKSLSEKNKKEGAQFLKSNKDKKGVKTTKSGLQYKVIKSGKGKAPKASDTVTVNYKGTLIDGTVFDSTDKTGKPVSFKLNEVIKGWTEVLQKMKPGAHWKVYIPPELAYGERGIGGPIGPNATLIFDIHLVSVKTGK